MYCDFKNLSLAKLANFPFEEFEELRIELCKHFDVDPEAEDGPTFQYMYDVCGEEGGTRLHELANKNPYFGTGLLFAFDEIKKNIATLRQDRKTILQALLPTKTVTYTRKRR